MAGELAGTPSGLKIDSVQIRPRLEDHSEIQLERAFFQHKSELVVDAFSLGAGCSASLLSGLLAKNR